MISVMTGDFLSGKKALRAHFHTANLDKLFTLSPSNIILYLTKVGDVQLLKSNLRPGSM